ncbi:hypothetical protein [Moraxella sp. K127]|uniref:hypothetical protein n=1 Tax=Moraxella sp. K127 TaxID=2780079 RepID=UPI00188106D5|nr:hypothetical protein [Moraxella sp. K127]
MKSHQKVQLLIMNNKQRLCQHEHHVQLYALFYLDSPNIIQNMGHCHLPKQQGRQMSLA